MPKIREEERVTEDDIAKTELGEQGEPDGSPAAAASPLGVAAADAAESQKSGRSARGRPAHSPG
jgi:hypothetical protein